TATTLLLRLGGRLDFRRVGQGNLSRRALDDRLRLAAVTRLLGAIAIAVTAALVALLMLVVVLLLLGRRCLLLRLDRRETVVHLVVGILVVANVANRLLRHLRHRRHDDAVIVLCVLQIVLGHDTIAGALGVPCECGVLFGDLLSGAADLYVRAVTLVRAG